MIDTSNSLAYDVALRAAESVHYHFKAFTTVNDLYQDAFEFLLRHPILWSQFEEAEDRKMAERTLDRIVMDHLRGIARREKATQSGYHVDDECTYTPKVVAELLPLIFDLEAALLPSAPTDDAPGRGSNPHGQGDFVTSLLDVRQAWTSTAFRGTEMSVLELRFVEQLEWDHLAASLSMEVEEAKRQAAIGLRRLSDRLGGLPARSCLPTCECKEVS